MSSSSMIPVFAAIAASQMNAQKAIGAIIRVDYTAFQAVLKDADAPLAAVSDSFWGGKKYLVNHKGLTFYCKTKVEIQVPANTQIITCNSINIPYA